jgi:hypothetical protein
MTQTSTAKPKRPSAVTLIGALLILISGFYIVQAVAGLSLSGAIQSALSNVLNTQGMLTAQAQTVAIFALIQADVQEIFVLRYTFYETNSNRPA